MPTGNPERTIRPLLRDDLDAAESILTAAFQRRANRRLDLERGFALAPESWFRDRIFGQGSFAFG